MVGLGLEMNRVKPTTIGRRQSPERGRMRTRRLEIDDREVVLRRTLKKNPFGTKVDRVECLCGFWKSSENVCLLQGQIKK